MRFFALSPSERTFYSRFDLFRLILNIAHVLFAYIACISFSLKDLRSVYSTSQFYGETKEEDEIK